MEKSAHSERKHARLSASGAYRWINSPGSIAQEVIAEELFGIEDESSPFAEEGTTAHEVAEAMLRADLGLIASDEAEKKIERLIAGDRSMQGYAREFSNRCLELIEVEKLKGNEPFVMIEERVEFTEWVPEGFGTCDFIMISANKLYVIDFKYGKGVPVSAVDNPQPRLYALGAIQEYGWIFDIKEVEMRIDQPRLNSLTTDVMQAEELLKWADEVVRPAALKAWDGSGEIRPGEWDRFSKIKGVCSVTASYMLNIINEFRE